MGSTHTGRFTDYPGTASGSSKPGGDSGSGGSGGEGGGSSDIDLCLRVIDNVALEEMPRSEYFLNHNDFPPAGTAVSVRANIVGGRLGVETVLKAELVGLLPTELNYLLRCIKQGYKYSGEILSVKSKPIPVVRVQLEPQL